jgi:nucleoid-associated protein YgaU
VTEQTDQIYQLMKIEPDTHAPPICAFLWNQKFPGADVSSKVGNQRRTDFQCVVENIKQRFTLFSPEGVPLRAILTVTLREYKTLDQQLKQLNLNSPDKTQSHVVKRGDTLSAIAGTHYRTPGAWRAIATENAISDPRRLSAGTFLRVPPMS